MAQCVSRFMIPLILLCGLFFQNYANTSIPNDEVKESKDLLDSAIAMGKVVGESTKALSDKLPEVNSALMTFKDGLKDYMISLDSKSSDSIIADIVVKSDSLVCLAREQVESILHLQSKLHSVTTLSKELHTQYITINNKAIDAVKTQNENAENILILSTKESAKRLQVLNEIEKLNVTNIAISDSIKANRTPFQKTLIDSINKLTTIINEEKDKLPIGYVSLRSKKVPIYKLDTLPITGCREVCEDKADTKLLKKVKCKGECKRQCKNSCEGENKSECKKECRKKYRKKNRATNNVVIRPGSDSVSIESVKLLLNNGIIQEVVAYSKDGNNSIEYENTRSYSISTIEAFKQFRTGVRESKESKDWKVHYYYLEYETSKNGKKERSFIFIPDLINLKRNNNLYSRTYVPENCTLHVNGEGRPQTIYSKSLVTSLDLRTYTDFFGLAKDAKNNLVNIELAATFIGSTKPYREKGDILWLKEFTPYFKYHLLKDDNRLSFDAWNMNTVQVVDKDVNGDSVGIKDTLVYNSVDSFSVYQIDALNNRSVDIGFQMVIFHLRKKIHTFDITAKTGVLMGTFNLVDTIISTEQTSRWRSTPEVNIYDTTEHTLYNPYFHLGAYWHFNATELLSFDLGGGVYPFIGVFEPNDWNGIDISSKIDDEIFRPFDLLWQINFKSKNSADYFFRAKYLMQLRSKQENADKHQDALGRLNLELGVSTTINQLLKLVTK